MDKRNIIILCILYAGILLFTSIYLVKVIKTKKYTPAHNGIIVSFMFYYLIIPILILINIDSLNVLELQSGKYCSNTFQRFIIDGEWKNFLYSILMITLAIFFYVLFYQKNYKINKSSNYKFDQKNTYLIVKGMMYFTLFIGLFSLIIFFASLGGIKAALSYAETMRKMSNSLVEEIGNAALFKITARLITITPFLALYLINENKHKKILYKAILIISLIASVLFYLYNAGRAPIILFFLCFLYALLSKKIKKTWSVIILLGLVSLPLLDVLDSLFVFFNTGTFEVKQSNYIYYLYQFSVPYKNTLILRDINEMYGLRFGKDFVTSILDLLPGINFEPAYANLSLFVRGTEWKSLGGIPADFITFLHMQFSFIGIIIFSSFMGFITQKIDYKLSLFEDKKMEHLFGGILTIFFFSMISSSDMASIIRGQFILLIIIFIILKSSKKETKQ